MLNGRWRLNTPKLHPSFQKRKCFPSRVYALVTPENNGTTQRLRKAMPSTWQFLIRYRNSWRDVTVVSALISSLSELSKLLTLADMIPAVNQSINVGRQSELDGFIITIRLLIKGVPFHYPCPTRCILSPRYMHRSHTTDKSLWQLRYGRKSNIKTTLHSLSDTIVSPPRTEVSVMNERSTRTPTNAVPPPEALITRWLMIIIIARDVNEAMTLGWSDTTRAAHLPVQELTVNKKIMIKVVFKVCTQLTATGGLNIELDFVFRQPVFTE
jgi:hypothetical protein